MQRARGLGPIGVWGHLDTLHASELRRYVSRVAELGYGALWVPDVVGREPFALLGAVVEAAEPMWLGTSIASIWARDPMTCRMAAGTVNELTEGRFVLGLGVSHPHLVEKLRGQTYDRPLTRMREYLAAYRRLPFRGPEAPGGAEPPIVIAALRPRMLELAATASSGAFPYLVSAERVRWMRGILDAAKSVVERPLLAVTLPVVLDHDPGAARQAARAYLRPYLRTPNYQASWEAQGFGPTDWAEPGSDHLVDSMVACGADEVASDRIQQLRDAGADHVALIPLAPDGTTERLATLEALAPSH